MSGAQEEKLRAQGMKSSKCDSLRVSSSFGEEHRNARLKRYSTTYKLVFAFVLVGFIASASALFWILSELGKGVFL